MSRILLSLFIGLFAFQGRAASADSKDVDTSKTDERKIEESENPKTGSRWVTETDTVDITGDPGPLASDARANWKTACDNWKKEFRESNHDSKIINLNCGSMVCSGDVGNKSCVSKAVYKIKTKED